MINIIRLEQELLAAGLPVVPGAALAIHKVSEDRTWENSTFVLRPLENQKVRVNWNGPPSPENISAASVIIVAHDGSPNAEERLDNMPLPPKVLAAIALRLSGSWTNTTPVEKSRVMNLIDQAGANALLLIRG